MKLSVIIPAHKELFLQKTIDSLLEVSELGDDIEVLPVWDGTEFMTPIKADSRVRVLHFASQRGMRAAINVGLTEATGKFVMKLDAHCAFDQGFDRKMVESCVDNWLLIPRRYSLDDINWSINEHKRDQPRDYHYLTYPLPLYPRMTPQVYDRSKGPEIDDTMSFQGSCWVANREIFMRRVGLLDDRKKTYGSFAAEQLEIGLKYWLKGGEVKVIKSTWYAHLRKMPRHYATGKFQMKRLRFKTNWNWATEYWLNNRDPDIIYKFSWLIEKFWPVPGWPEDRSQWNPFKI